MVARLNIVSRQRTSILFLSCGPSAAEILRSQFAARASMTERMLLELNIRLEAIIQTLEGKFLIPMNSRVLGGFVGLSSVHICRT